MDYRADFQAHLDWLVLLWKQAAFRQHAVARANEMAAQAPELYRRMPEALREITDRLKIEASARRAEATSPDKK